MKCRPHRDTLASSVVGKHCLALWDIGLPVWPDDLLAARHSVKKDMDVFNDEFLNYQQPDWYNDAKSWYENELRVVDLILTYLTSDAEF